MLPHPISYYLFGIDPLLFGMIVGSLFGYFALPKLLPTYKNNHTIFSRESDAFYTRHAIWLAVFTVVITIFFLLFFRPIDQMAFPLLAMATVFYLIRRVAPIGKKIVPRQ